MPSEVASLRRPGGGSLFNAIVLLILLYGSETWKSLKEKLPKQVLSWTPDGSRRRGRPKEAWRRTIRSDIRAKELNAEEFENVAARREDWKRFIADLWASLVKKN